MGSGEAICHGAATIINAIAMGKGAAFGVDTWTRAKVELTHDSGVIEAKIASDLSENPVLIEETVRRVFGCFRVEPKLGARVVTQSNIPIARGLKSSSVAANAVALATISALDKNLDDLKTIKLGVDAAISAGVTVTGAFDDACASYFGCGVITNNLTRRVIRKFDLTEELAVLFHIPAQKVYKRNVNVEGIRQAAPLVKSAYRKALNGNYWSALTLNGLIHSSALGLDPSVALDALSAGALAAGLSGTGPAVIAVVSSEKVDDVKVALKSHGGDLLQTRINHEKATILS